MRRAHRLAVAAGFALAAGSLGVARLASVDRDPGVGDARALAAASEAARADAAVAVQPGIAIDAAAASAAVATYAGSAAPDLDRDAAERDRRAPAAAPRVVLDDPQVALGSAVAIGGRDPGAPRALALWRLDGDRAVRVATGSSEADGTLAFPPLALPAGEVTLVATPLGARPTDPGASSPATVQRDPSAPQIESIEVAGHTLVLRAAPVEAGGALVVTAATAQGDVELARVAVADDVEASRVALDLSLALAPDAESLSIAHELSDGRRSARRTVSVSNLNPWENRDVESIAELLP